MFCSILESAAMRSEMEVVPRCENDVQVDALTVVDFTMLLICGFYRISLLVPRGCYYRLAFHCWVFIYTVNSNCAPLNTNKTPA